MKQQITIEVTGTGRYREVVVEAALPVGVLRYAVQVDIDHQLKNAISGDYVWSESQCKRDAALAALQSLFNNDAFPL